MLFSEEEISSLNVKQKLQFMQYQLQQTQHQLQQAQHQLKQEQLRQSEVQFQTLCNIGNSIITLIFIIIGVLIIACFFSVSKFLEIMSNIAATLQNWKQDLIQGLLDIAAQCKDMGLAPVIFKWLFPNYGIPIIHEP